MSQQAGRRQVDAKFVFQPFRNMRTDCITEADLSETQPPARVSRRSILRRRQEPDCA
jgi:hypothetical protein